MLCSADRYVPPVHLKLCQMENPNYIEVVEEETFGFAEASAKSWPSSGAVANEGKKAKLSDVVDARMNIEKKSGIHGHLLETWYETDLAKVAPGKEFMLARTTVYQRDLDTCVPCFLLIFLTNLLAQPFSSHFFIPRRTRRFTV